MAQRLAVFPGSFDPLTNGHVDVVHRVVRLFDRVVIAILKNTGKKSMFTVDERIAMLREVFAGNTQVEVDAFQGLLVDYARAKKAIAIVRGVRTASDLEYERQLALTNRHLNSEIETVLLLPAAEVAHISSSLVREIVSLGGSARGLVPPAIDSWLDRKPQSQQTRRA
jgi:pantetheine-phosphate adenylyltransferase